MAEELRAAIIQDDTTGRVLMLGWMDDEALALTRSSGTRALLLPFAPAAMEKGRDLGQQSARRSRSCPTATRTPFSVASQRRRSDLSRRRRRRVSRRGSGERFFGERPSADRWLVRRRATRGGHRAQCAQGGRGGRRVAVAALSEDDERVVSEAADSGSTCCCSCAAAGLIPRRSKTNFAVGSARALLSVARSFARYERDFEPILGARRGHPPGIGAPSERLPVERTHVLRGGAFF